MKIKKWLVFVLNAVGLTPASGINSVLYTYSVPLHESAKEHTSKANCLLSADGSHHQSQVITHSDSVNERVK
jgi:aromatic ring-opening dioxygenase LigB subunit